MKNEIRLVDTIKPGDMVTIVDRFGKKTKGRATIHNRKDDLWVLNIGGIHGRGAIADDTNIIKVGKR